MATHSQSLGRRFERERGYLEYEEECKAIAGSEAEKKKYEFVMGCRWW